MAKTVANITVGAPATILVGAYGDAEGSSVDLGATLGGLKIVSAPEYFWKTADQWPGKLGGSLISEDVTAEVILAEATQANLTYAFGYPTDAQAGGTFDYGGNTTVTERTIYINGVGPDSANRKITIHKAVLVGSPEYEMLRDGTTGLKVTIQLLQDTSQTENKQYFSVVDSGGDTTPPTVAMTDPAEDATVTKEAKGTVTLTFTEADSAIDQGSLIYGSADKATVMIMNVTDTANTSLVAGSISYNATSKVLTFTPTDNWTASDKHQIIITTGVRDTAGNYLASIFIGHFTVTA